MIGPLTVSPDVQASLYADDVTILYMDHSLRGCGNTSAGCRRDRRLDDEMEGAAKHQQMLIHLFLPGPKGDWREGRPPPQSPLRGAAETRTAAN